MKESFTSKTDKRLLFKFDQGSLERNIIAIENLKTVTKEIERVADCEGKIGVTEAKKIFESFRYLFTDLESNSVKEEIATREWSDYHKRLIVHFVNQLMVIPYKYGRQHLDKEPLSKQSCYLTNIGLMTLAKELKRDPENIDTKLLRSILRELKEQLPIVLEFFHEEQLKSLINDEKQPRLNNIKEEIYSLEMEIEKIKVVKIRKDLEEKRILKGSKEKYFQECRCARDAFRPS